MSGPAEDFPDFLRAAVFFLDDFAVVTIMQGEVEKRLEQRKMGYKSNHFLDLEVQRLCGVAIRFHGHKTILVLFINGPE